MQKLMSGVAAMAMILVLPLTVSAQEAEAPETEAAEICTATIAPIHAGEKVAAKATFAEPFGQIVAIETSAESGLALVTEKKHAEGEMVEMADEDAGEADAAVELTEEIEGEGEAEAAVEAENASVFWLNATEATAGTYEIALKNEAGASCAAEITVEEAVEAEKTGEQKDGEEY